MTANIKHKVLIIIEIKYLRARDDCSLESPSPTFEIDAETDFLGLEIGLSIGELYAQNKENSLSICL
jgi:hypothetical protein